MRKLEQQRRRGDWAEKEDLPSTCWPSIYRHAHNVHAPVQFLNNRDIAIAGTVIFVFGIPLFYLFNMYIHPTAIIHNQHDQSEVKSQQQKSLVWSGLFLVFMPLCTGVPPVIECY
jgi:hypothetical protein